MDDTAPETTLTITAVGGFEPVLRFAYGGREYHINRAFELSRHLTGTDGESGMSGIFEPCPSPRTRGALPPTTVTFEVGGRSQAFEFASFAVDGDLATIRDRLLERIAAVRAWVADTPPVVGTLAFEVPQ